jgi:hypothetical protein
MSAFTDFLDSMTASMKDRVSNPLSGSFIIAWCIANFRLLLVIVGDGDFDKKLTYINTYLSPNHLGWFEFLARSIGWPLAWALFYVFAYPKISFLVMSFTRNQQNLWHAKQAAIDNQKPLLPAAATKLRTQVAELEARLADAETRHNTERERDQEAILEIGRAREAFKSRIETVEAENLQLRDGAVLSDLVVLDALPEVTPEESRLLGDIAHRSENGAPVEVAEIPAERRAAFVGLRTKGLVLVYTKGDLRRVQPTAPGNEILAQQEEAATPLDHYLSDKERHIREVSPQRIASDGKVDLVFRDRALTETANPTQSSTQPPAGEHTNQLNALPALDDQVIMQPVPGGADIPRLTRREATVLVDLKERSKHKSVRADQFSQEALFAVDSLVEQNLLRWARPIEGPQHLVFTSRGSNAEKAARELMGPRNGPHSGLYSTGATWMSTASEHSDSTAK